MRKNGKRTLACTLAASFFLVSVCQTSLFAEELIIEETDSMVEMESDQDEVIIDQEVVFDENDILLDEFEERTLQGDEPDSENDQNGQNDSELLFELQYDDLENPDLFEEYELFTEEKNNSDEFSTETPAHGSVTDIDLASSDELFEQYVDKQMYEGVWESPVQLYSVDYSGRSLDAVQKSVYSNLKKEIDLVAKGQKSEAVFSFTVSELKGKKITRAEIGEDIITDTGYISSKAADALLNTYITRAILDALTFDCPYELYWFDKTVGYQYNLDARYRVTGDGTKPSDELSYATIPEITFWFYVGQEFKPAGVTEATCEIDRSKTSAATNAVRNAKAYAANVEGMDDITQYTYFKEVICDLVDYNYDAVHNNVPYGNPWQLIWVFDQDPSTDVVCEGYSKAFQYLCELNGLPCISVSGDFNGAHMWNVARLSDGRNYLVDLTNCDDDGVGYPDKLFLTPMTGNVYDGFTKRIEFENGSSDIANYSYDLETIDAFSLSWLRISNLPYGQKQEMLPTPVLKSVKPSGNRVAISWGAVDGVDMYRVYRRVHGQNSWSNLADVFKTEYIDTNVVSGTTYEYTVRGMTIDELALTSYNKTGMGICYLGRPESIKVSNVDGGPKISWNAVGGATKYKVFRKTGSESWSCVKSTTGTSMKDTSALAGVEYAYTVSAVASGYNESGVKKTFNSDYNRNGVVNIFVDEVKVSALTNTSDGITLKWKRVDGAAGYYVYRKISGGSYKKIASVGKNKASYTDTVKLTNGSVYDYAVRAYSGAYKGAYEALRTARLTIPAISRCSNTAKGVVTVNWKRNAKATGYQIGYKLGSTLNKVTIRNNTTVTRQVTGLRKGQTYSFYVRSYKNVGGKNYYSAWSKVKTLKITR